MRTKAILFAGLFALPATAQDYVVTPDGMISDTNFYNLVSCAAPVDQECARRRYFWPKGSLISVQIKTRDRIFLGRKIKRADASVVRAIKALNAVGLPLRLAESKTPKPDISIHLLDVERGSKIADSGIAGIDGIRLTNAATRLFVEESTIERATIIISKDLSVRSYESVMLEELTQALGLITDIRNPYYEGRSIFSQDAPNDLRSLGDQDIMALRRHYPLN